MSRTIYVAARLADAPAAREIARQLRSLGHQTTSLWHDADPVDLTRESQIQDRAQRQRIARQNYDGVYRANTLLLLGHPDGRGSIAEAITAYRYGHDVLIVGDPLELTPMLDLTGVHWFRAIGDAMDYLRNAEKRL